jgi:hypothetical protein
MELTKGTLLSAIVLVCLFLGVSFIRTQLVKQRDACGAQMVEISTILEEYAKKHHGKLPSKRDDLKDTLGKYDGIYVGPVTAELSFGSFYRSKKKPVPYLWDPSPHMIIGLESKYHVLYTNGDIFLQPECPRAQPQL